MDTLPSPALSYDLWTWDRIPVPLVDGHHADDPVDLVDRHSDQRLGKDLRSPLQKGMVTAPAYFKTTDTARVLIATKSKEKNMSNSSRAKSTLTAVMRLVVGIAMIGAMLFLPAGTFKYLQAWAWLATQFIPMGISLVYLLKIDPALLERRTRTNETRPEQRRIIMASVVYFLIVFLLPGFDVRHGWSNVPAWLCLAADGIVLASYILYVLVMKANTFASRVIEVEQGQQVITIGPYAIVRHPMYLAMILMMTASPLALGSYWAMLPSILLILLLAARAKNEEELLEKELNGYREYMQKTRYRLFPGVW